MLHQTALHATHEALGATLVDFGGWDMPLWYPTGAVKEHLAVIRHFSHNDQFSRLRPT